MSIQTAPEAETRTRSKERVRALISDSPEPLDAAAVAERLGLHLSTVRFHLAHLEDTGALLRTSVKPPGRGRPRNLYRAAPRARTEESQRQLIEALAEALARAEHPEDRAADAGRSWADSLKAAAPALPESKSATNGRAESPSHTGGGSLRATLEQLGFDPEDRGNTGFDLRACPFRETAARHPEVVCAVHRGLIERTVELEGGNPTAVHLIPFTSPGLCTITFDND